MERLEGVERRLMLIETIAKQQKVIEKQQKELENLKMAKSSKVKIIEILTLSSNPVLHNTETKITEFDSFEEYLNLMAVGRSGFPVHFKVLNREKNIAAKEVKATIINANNDEVYQLLAKVL